MFLKDLFKKKPQKKSIRSTNYNKNPRRIVADPTRLGGFKMKRVVIDTIEASELQNIMEHITMHLAMGELTGRVAFPCNFSPIARKILQYMANGEIYIQNNRYYINWDYTEVTE